MASTPHRYDREQSEQKLIAAVGRLLAEQGPDKVGINAIAKTAGLDKVLIYRYFDGLPNLLSAYGQSRDFWPTVEEVLGDEPSLRALPPEQRLERVLTNLMTGLQRRPQTIAIMAWELVHKNPLTDMLAEVREQWGQAVLARASQDLPTRPAELAAIANLLVAGLHYLLIRSRTCDHFGGISLVDETGWQRWRAGLAALCRGMAAAEWEGTP